MKHVKWDEVVHELCTNPNWGREAEDVKEHIKRAGHDELHTALLVDIARSLRSLERTFSCPNFRLIPERLRLIEKNTRPKPRKRKR